MVTTAVACVIGLVLATVFNNAGLFPNLSEAAQAAEYEAKEYAGFMATLVAIFPTNMWKAFTEANMLQVIVIALLFGGSILAAGEKSKLVRDMVTSAYAVVERLMEFIISLSPIGVFTYMTWVVATQGAEILGSLALVILCAYIGYILHAGLFCFRQGVCRHQPRQVLQERFRGYDLRLYLHLLRRDPAGLQGVRRCSGR